jgi:hypothetical protein
MLPSVATRIALPGATPVTSPELLTVATPVALEVQVTVEVQSALELFEELQVAVYCWVPPTTNESDEGVTVTLVRETLPIPMLILPVPDEENTSTPAASAVALDGVPSPVIAYVAFGVRSDTYCVVPPEAG